MASSNWFRRLFCSCKICPSTSDSDDDHHANFKSSATSLHCSKRSEVYRKVQGKEEELYVAAPAVAAPAAASPDAAAPAAAEYAASVVESSSSGNLCSTPVVRILSPSQVILLQSKLSTTTTSPSGSSKPPAFMIPSSTVQISSSSNRLDRNDSGFKDGSQHNSIDTAKSFDEEGGDPTFPLLSLSDDDECGDIFIDHDVSNESEEIRFLHGQHEAIESVRKKILQAPDDWQALFDFASNFAETQDLETTDSSPTYVPNRLVKAEKKLRQMKQFVEWEAFDLSTIQGYSMEMVALNTFTAKLNNGTDGGRAAMALVDKEWKSTIFDRIESADIFLAGQAWV